MAKLYNLARMTTPTIGTGTITLGGAVSGFLTFALAGVTDGQIVSYGIRDGANSEVGTGTYTSAGTTLTRTVSKSTNADAAISLSGSAQVYISATKEDIANLREANAFTDTTVSTSSTTGALIVAGGVGIGGALNIAGKTQISIDSAATNTVTPIMRLSSSSTGTPANGIGASLEFEVETTAGNLEIGATIEAVATDVTSTSEDFDLVFKTMAAGAAATEHMRIASTGNVGINQAQSTNAPFDIFGDGTNCFVHFASDTSATIQGEFFASETFGAVRFGSGTNHPVQLGSNGTERMRLDGGGDITIRSDIATPAGGSTSARLLFGTTAGFGIYYGSGAPTVSAASGSIYIRTDNAGASLRLYSNTTGSTTWAAITSA